MLSSMQLLRFPLDRYPSERAYDRHCQGELTKFVEIALRLTHQVPFLAQRVHRPSLGLPHFITREIPCTHSLLHLNYPYQ